MRVFSSMKGDEISAAGTTSVGAKLLREFLLYAEHGRLESVMANVATDTESPFEHEVFIDLTLRGLTLVPQVGVAGYRIDFGVLDDLTPGQFLCGIECDGVAYHASETARDRDRLRQQVLEARGWTIYRVWSTDWFKDRQGQIERLLSLVEQSRRRAHEEARAEREAQSRVTAERAAANDAEAVSTASRPAAVPDMVYERPTAAPYHFTTGEGHYAGTELLDTPPSQLIKAVVAVVETEAPLHTSDLATRVAGMWSSRVGTRIMARISEVCRAAERDGLLIQQDGFILRPDGRCMVRSRAGTRIPAERIAPEEYREAILLVLRDGHGFTRPELSNEVRAVLGFGRAGAQLETAISNALNDLLAHSVVGEGSTGITIRR
jgi:very-short-patch-repair endonuclease